MATSREQPDDEARKAKAVDADHLGDQVYTCDSCAPLKLGFTRSGPGRPFFKFPPLIGAQGAAPLLFIGLNPRRAAGDVAFHDRLMRDPEAFEALARNRVEGGRYIAINGRERHYNLRVRIAAAAYPGHEFEEVAAVTELFLCASESGAELPRKGSPCADRYLVRVAQIVRPTVIVAVGKAAENYLRPSFGHRDGPFRRLIGNVNTLVIPIRHPNARGTRSAEEKDAVVAEVRRALGLAVPDAGPDVADAEATTNSSSAPTSRLPNWPWLLFAVATFASAATASCCCGGL